MADNKANKEQVHRVLQNISKKCDRLSDIVSFEQHKVRRKYIMKGMDVRKGTKALDACCGTGDWTVALSKAVKPAGEATGIDFNENMLEAGKEKTASMGNAKLAHDDAMELSFEDNSLDYVTTEFGLRNMPGYLVMLKEINRVLKPDGVVVCFETSQPALPVFKQVYVLYFKFVVPIFGKLFVKSKGGYEWLQQSTFSFPGGEELKHMFEGADFINVRVRNFTGGVATMHPGYKGKDNTKGDQRGKVKHEQ